MAATRPGSETWPGGVVTLRVPHHPRSVKDVRHCLRASLEAQGLSDDIVNDTEIVVAELLGNAVRHAAPLSGGEVEISWRVRSGAVELQVKDGGSSGAVELSAADPLSVWGRGLHIVSTVSWAWGVVDLRGGERTVWASLVPSDEQHLAHVS
ncbi:MAG: ATP-binding protein [Actinomycetales bacterium]|nr:ATP-binding protein [Actinomycetales bacterium]